MSNSSSSSSSSSSKSVQSKIITAIQSVENICDQHSDFISANEHPLKGKWVSIIGESQSAFTAWCNVHGGIYWADNNKPNDYNDVQDVSDMWWYKLITKTGAKLCTCAALTGSALANPDISSGVPENAIGDNSVVERVVTWRDWMRISGHTYRNIDGSTEVATSDVVPDYIFIMAGSNDIKYNKDVVKIQSGLKEYLITDNITLADPVENTVIDPDGTRFYNDHGGQAPTPEAASVEGLPPNIDDITDDLHGGTTLPSAPGTILPSFTTDNTPNYHKTQVAAQTELEILPSIYPCPDHAWHPDKRTLLGAVACMLDHINAWCNAYHKDTQVYCLTPPLYAGGWSKWGGYVTNQIWNRSQNLLQYIFQQTAAIYSWHYIPCEIKDYSTVYYATKYGADNDATDEEKYSRFWHLNKNGMTKIANKCIAFSRTYC